MRELAIIKAPNKDYNGVSASVTFVKGVGETDNPHLIEWFKSHGYEVVQDAAEEGLKVPDPIPDEDETSKPKSSKKKTE